jgi:hypothetical protein
VKAAGPFSDWDLVRRSLLAQLVLPCGDSTSVESIPDRELLRHSFYFLCHLHMTRLAHSVLVFLLSAPGQNGSIPARSLGLRWIFFSRVEAFGSHVDSVQRFHLCEQIVDNPTLVLIHVCARSIVPFSVLRGTGARLDSLVVCVCAAPAPGRVR